MLRRFALWALVVLGLALGAGCSRLLAGIVEIRVPSWTLESVTPDGTGFQVVYRPHCQNANGDVLSSAVLLTDAGADATVIDGLAQCGAIPAAGGVDAADTVMIFQTTADALDPSAMAWVFVALGSEDRLAQVRLTRQISQYTYWVALGNVGPAPLVLSAMAMSSSPATRAVIGLAVGEVPAGSTLDRAGILSVQQDRIVPFDPGELHWSLRSDVEADMAVGLTRSLDGVGHPLGEVRVDEDGPEGPSVQTSETDSGLVNLAQRAGEFRWRFSKDGHLPVWRQRTLTAGEVALVHSPWLERRDPVQYPLTVLNGGSVGDPDEWTTVSFAPGSFPANAKAVLTELSGQTLPAVLPIGWSPLNAFWLELDVEPQADGTAHLRFMDSLDAGERGAFVRLDASDLSWNVLSVVDGTGSDGVDVSLPGSGAYAFVVPDVFPVPPPAALVGAPLAPANASFPDPATLTGEGHVEPGVSAASLVPEEVTAEGRVEIGHDDALPSGLLLRAEVDERYRFFDGSEQQTPRYQTFLVGYQRPGDRDPNTLNAHFPLQPTRLFGPTDLSEATLEVEILTVSAFAGAVLGESGGAVISSGATAIVAAGALEGETAVELRQLDPAELSKDGVQAFDLGVSGVLPGQRLDWLLGRGSPGTHYVLARAVSGFGLSGLEPRERYVADATGLIVRDEPATGGLPGVTASGRYVLVQVDGPQGLVEGTARDTQGVARAGLAVRIEGAPWLTFSAEDGGYQLVAGLGAGQVVVLDPNSGDRAEAPFQLADASAVEQVDLATVASGPVVVAVEPEDGQERVSTAAPVVVSFSEPIAVESFGPSGLVLLDGADIPVPGAVSLNLAGDEVTLLPDPPLAASTLYTIVLHPGLRDLQGLPIEGALEFSFTTAAPAARGVGAELVSWEPGAASSPCVPEPGQGSTVPGFDPDDPNIACVQGGPGTADPDVPVILVNETTGATATVLSNLDGSFLSFVDADVDDFIAATFVNANGTRIRIPLSRQNFDDGSVALFESGGILEASNEEEGTATVFIEPGAIETKSKFKMDVLGAAELLAAIQNTPPENGQLLGGFRFQFEGDDVEGEADVTYPADLDELGITEEEAEDAAFALAIVQEFDGETAYQIVDKMRYEDGEVTTNTFPFLGMMAAVGGAYFDARDVFNVLVVPMFLGNSAVVVHGTVYRCPANEEGGCFGEDIPGVGLVTDQPSLYAKPLPGAYVVLDRPSGGSPFPSPGRLRRGVAYAHSDQEGNYALVAPTGLSGYVLTASHPRSSYVAAEPIFGFLDFALDGAIAKDLVLVDSSVGVASPPRMSVAHEPYYPQPTQTATMVVNASQPAAAPEIDVDLLEVESLVAGVDASEEDVTVSEPVEEILSPTKKRVTLTITSGKAVYVTLRVRSWSPVAAGPPVEITHGVAFTGGPTAGDDPLEPADPDDAVGPVVVGSFPVEGALGVMPGQRIEVLFNEPVSNALLDQPGAVTLTGPIAAPVALELSDDQQTLIVTPGVLSDDAAYTLQVSPAVTDLAENALDQDAGLEGDQGFTLNFTTAETPIFALDEVGDGGGVAMHRDWAYVLDRADDTVKIYDVTKPASPLLLDSVSVPGTPRGVLVIPEYSYALRYDGEPRTTPLLVVSGGNLGTLSVGNDGSVFNPGQYLRVFDLGDPAAPDLIASPRITLQQAVVDRLEWHPPYLTYFENGSDLQQIGAIHLQKFLLGYNLAFDELGVLGLFPFAGNDANGDGDFVDEGEVLPRPAREPVEFFGKEFACTLVDTPQRILDFHFEPGFCGVTLRAGTEPEEVPAYRTVTMDGLELHPQTARYDFAAGAYPKRVKVLFDARVKVGDEVSSRILALVSLSPASDGAIKLAVVDITLPESPALLKELSFPEEMGLGLLQSVFQREDGLLGLATTRDVVLLDPERLGDDAPQEGLHPAIVGVIPSAGSGGYAQESTRSGLNVVALGGRSQIVLTPPRIRFVSFPGASAVADVPNLVDQPDTIETLFEDVLFADGLFPARLRGEGGATPSLSPPSPQVHYHVLIDAPGGVGAEIPLALESLNRSAHPLKNLGRSFPPVRAASADALEAMGQEARDGCDAPIGGLVARRLSSDPASPYYDQFLSEPFALTYERVSESELQTLQGELARTILWSGAYLRASIDPSFASDPNLGAFAAQVHEGEKVLRPGVAAVARAFPAAYVVGPNPPPSTGHTALPGSYGNVSAHNGEFRHETVDLQLPGRRMPIIFERAIGGQDLYEGAFGRGWDFSYDERLEPLDGDVFPTGQTLPLVVRGDDPEAADPEDTTAESGDVLWHTGRGRVVHFEYEGDAAPPEIADDPLIQELGWADRGIAFYLPQPGHYDVLVRFASGEFGRLTPRGEQFFYGKKGRLQRIKDVYPKNEHVLNRNSRGQLVRITDRAAEERFVEVGYYRFASDPLFQSDLDVETGEPFVAGKIARLRDYAGRDVLFHYNDDGLLERREGFDLEGANEGFDGRPSTHYLSDQACSGAIQGVVVGASQSDDGTPLFVGQLQNADEQPEVEGGNTASGSVQISLQGENVAGDVANGETSLIAADGSIVTLAFDENGRPTQMTSALDGEEEVHGTDFGDDGALDVRTTPEGDEIRYTWDRENDVFRARGNLLEIEWVPGPRGGDTYKETFPSYDLRYNVPVGTRADVDGNEITITLTSDGRQIESQTLPGVGGQSWTYNEYGQILTYETGTGLTSAQDYQLDTGFLAFSQQGSFQTFYDYDESLGGKLGMPTTIRTPRSDDEDLEVVYDARLSPVTLTRGTRVEQRAYDENRNLILREMALGDGQTFSEERSYDERGFLEWIKVQDVEVDGEDVELETNFAPNDVGEIGQIQHPGGEVTDFTHDSMGRVLTITTGDQTRRFERDGNGNVTEVYLNDVLVEAYVYDGHDRVTERKRPTADGEIVVATSWFPSGVLKTETVTDPVYGEVQDVEVTEIDALGRVRQVTVHGDQVSATVDTVYAAGANGYTQTVDGPRDFVTIEVDAAGRVDVHTNGRRSLDYGFDDNGNLTSIVSTDNGILPPYDVDYTIDSLDRTTELSDGEGRLSKMTPRQDGREIGQVDSLDRTTTTPRSVLGELVGLERPNGVGFEFQHTEHRALRAVLDVNGDGRKFVYDPSFRLETITFRDGSTTTFSSFDHQNLPQDVQLPGGSRTVGYDDLGRMEGSSTSYAGQDDPFAVELAYDGLDRIRHAIFGAGVEDEWSMDYDRIGAPSASSWKIAGGDYEIGYDLYADGTTSSISYPSGAQLGTVREESGRLTTLGDGAGSIHHVSEWAAADAPARVELGGSIVREDLHDARRRLVARRYQRVGDGQVLAEWRWVHDALDQPVLSQRVHDAGRADVHAYDDGFRLVRAHHGARPASPADGGSPWAEAPYDGFVAGHYQRSYTHDGGGLDLLEAIETEAPADAEPPPSASAFADFDDFLIPQTVDGVARSAADPLGSVASTRLATRPAGAAAPQLATAGLEYDGTGQLVRVVLPAGRTIEYDHDHRGLVYRKRVLQDDALVSDRVLIWDRGRLIEEYEISGSEPVLAGRYYYDHADFPVAADVGPGLERHYLLMDRRGDVEAIADAAGNVVERIRYDAFGQPAIEGQDTVPPRVQRVEATADGLVIVFSEPVAPPLEEVEFGPDPVASVLDVAERATLSVGGSAVSGELQVLDTLVGFPSHHLLRFVPGGTAAVGTFTLALEAGTVVDGWGNPNTAESVVFAWNGSDTGLLFDAGALATAPPRRARSALEMPFLFHGQYFDYDAGLVYLRARFYDPTTAAFLQRDPAGYVDSPNLYAAFGHNPVRYQDPLGTNKGGAGRRIAGEADGVNHNVQRRAVRDPHAEAAEQAQREAHRDALKKAKKHLEEARKAEAARRARRNARPADDVQNQPPVPPPGRNADAPDNPVGQRPDPIESGVPPQDLPRAPELDGIPPLPGQRRFPDPQPPAAPRAQAGRPNGPAAADEMVAVPQPQRVNGVSDALDRVERAGHGEVFELRAGLPEARGAQVPAGPHATLVNEDGSVVIRDGFDELDNIDVNGQLTGLYLLRVR